MTHSLRGWMHRGLLPAAVALVFTFTGCSNDPGPGERPAATMPRQRPTPMAGQETFFAEQILAEVRVGTDGLPDAAPGEGGERGGEGRRSRGGGHGQMSIGGGSGGIGGNISGGMPFGEGGGRGRRGGGYGGEENAPRVVPGPRVGLMGGGRPVMIHLRFTNQGTAPVTVIIDDFVSPLGNFAVRPEQLSLAPGQALETEPMTSQLAGALAETDATLVLRIGAKGEKKTFHLHAVVPAKTVDGPPEPAQAPNPPKS